MTKPRTQTALSYIALVVLSAATGLLGLRPPESYLGVTVALLVSAAIYYIDELPFGGTGRRRRQR